MRERERRRQQRKVGKNRNRYGKELRRGRKGKEKVGQDRNS